MTNNLKYFIIHHYIRIFKIKSSRKVFKFNFNLKIIQIYI